ncbi:MAG: plasmid stabilization protein [Methylocystaceae bacterium]|nr:MAG: plasmid stabilization protein [Methylocystaceae bacterium]
MASITIRNLDDDLKRRLRMRAAENVCSMEKEAREILRCAIGGVIAPTNLGQAIHARFAAIGGVELELPARGPMREPLSFS